MKQLMKALSYNNNYHGLFWWEYAALQAYKKGWCFNITDRHGKESYLSRFWLTPPKRQEHCKEYQCPWETSDSVLLHYMHRCDNDPALHDHPWNFDTTILSGGYSEMRPRLFDWPHEQGPILNTCKLYERVVGDTLHRKATDLHMVKKPLLNTWTLVRCGERVRKWGFHGAGEPWIPWDVYLGVTG